MNRLTFIVPTIAALIPASLSAMSPFEAPTVEEARAVYAQCLSVAGAKSGCTQHRQALVEAADGNLDVVAALDSIDDQFGREPARPTRAVRVKRVTLTAN